MIYKCLLAWEVLEHGLLVGMWDLTMEVRGDVKLLKNTLITDVFRVHEGRLRQVVKLTRFLKPHSG